MERSFCFVMQVFLRTLVQQSRKTNALGVFELDDFEQAIASSQVTIIKSRHIFEFSVGVFFVKIMEWNGMHCE